MFAEIRMRGGQAYAAIRKIKKLLVSKALGAKTKAQLIQVYVVSTLLHNSGTWVGVGEREKRILRKPLAHAARLALKAYVNGKPTVSDSGALKAVGMPDLEVLLVRSRMGVLQSFIKQQNAILTAVLAVDEQYKSQCLYDLERIVVLSKAFHGVCRVDAHAVGAIGQMTKEQWRQVVVKASASLEEAPAGTNVCVEVKDGIDTSVSEDWFCLKCNAIFDNKQKWATHVAIKHREGHEARFLAKGSQCQACLMEFHHRSKLVDHLKHSRCIARLRGRIIPYTFEAEREEFKAWSDSSGRTSAGKTQMCFKLTDIPAMVAEGPLPHWADFTLRFAATEDGK
jgi:hypothetical protein